MSLSNALQQRVERFAVKAFVSCYRTHFSVRSGVIARERVWKGGEGFPNVFIAKDDPTKSAFIGSAVIKQDESKKGLYEVGLPVVLEEFGGLGFCCWIRIRNAIPRLVGVNGEGSPAVILLSWQFNDCYPGTKFSKMTEITYDMTSPTPKLLQVVPPGDEIDDEAAALLERRSGRLH